MKSARNKFFFSLANKAVIALFIVLLPIVLVFIWGYKAESHMLKKDTLADLQVIAEAYESQIYHFLDSLSQRARDYASDGYIRSRLSRILQGNISAVSTLNDHLIKNKLELDKHLLYIDVVSLTGKIVASTVPSHIGKDVSQDSFFIKTTKTLKANISLDLSDSLPTFEVGTPIFDLVTKKPIGLLVNDYPLNLFNQVLSGQFAHELGALTWQKGRRKSLEIYLVNKKKQFLTESRFIKNAILKQIVDTKAVNACLNSNTEITGFYKNYRGVEVAGASMCFPSQKWVLFAEIDKAEALAPVRILLTRTIIIGLIFLLFIIIVFWLVIRYIVSPLKMISDATQQIAKGQFNISVPVTTSDEIGMLSQGFNNMAHELKNNISALMESEALLKETQKVAHFGSWSLDLVSNIFRRSDELCHILGLTDERGHCTFDHEALLKMVHPDDRQLVHQSFDEAVHKYHPAHVDYRIIKPNIGERIISEHIEIIRDEKDQPIRILGTINDITERKQAELKLAKLTAAIQQSVNLIMITDKEAIVEYVNPAFEKASGFAASEIIGQKNSFVSSGKTEKSLYRDLWKTIYDGKIWRGTIQNKRKNGKFYWAKMAISPIKNQQGEITHFLSIQEDITEKIETGKKVKFIARHDMLTKLFNRGYFFELLERWIAENKEKQNNGALLLIGLDQFRLFNDVYGQGFGDQQLKQAGLLLKHFVENFPEIKERKSENIVARLGGDEFIIFLPGLNGARAMVVAEKIRKMIEKMQVKKLDYHFSACVGISLYPQGGSDLKTLLSKADLALFRAKHLGRNQAHLYCEEDESLEVVHSRLTQKEMILEALEKNRFEPWFQPILEINSNEIHHYESLARLRDQKGNILLPASFIDVAERFGLVQLIDKMIIQKALASLKALNDSGKQLSFSMNLSGYDLTDTVFLSFLDKVIKESGVDPGNIIFEITETAAIQNIDPAIRFIKQVKSLGCQFALDDFGVGFTSFVYLKKLEVDYIKIDGFFIKELDENSEDQLFVKAIAEVAEGMGIKTIAEFVEKKEVLKLLKKFKVDYAQGYYIGKPAPIIK